MIRTGVFDYEDALTQSVGLTLFNCFTDDLVHLISDNSADILLRKSTIMSFNGELTTQCAKANSRASI